VLRDLKRATKGRGPADPTRISAIAHELPPLAEALKPPCRPPPSAARDLRTGGILLALAFAMAIMGFMISKADPAMAQHHGGFHPLYGAAFFPGLIGLVLVGFGLLGGRSRLGD